MNYFDLYGIPVLMKVDKDELRKKFHQLSREYHPDFHTRSDASEQAGILDKSADINRAYKIFQNPDETIRYVLLMKNLIQEEEKYELGPDFLGEVMEINEKLMDLEFDPDPAKLDEAERVTRDLLHKAYAHVEPIIENYQEDITSEKELLQVKDYYYQKKYLQRILDRIFQMRNIAPL